MKCIAEQLLFLFEFRFREQFTLFIFRRQFRVSKREKRMRTERICTLHFFVVAQKQWRIKMCAFEYFFFRFSLWRWVHFSVWCACATPWTYRFHRLQALFLDSRVASLRVKSVDLNVSRSSSLSNDTTLSVAQTSFNVAVVVVKEKYRWLWDCTERWIFNFRHFIAASTVTIRVNSPSKNKMHFT